MSFSNQFRIPGLPHTFAGGAAWIHCIYFSLQLPSTSVPYENAAGPEMSCELGKTSHGFLFPMLGVSRQ